MMLLGVAFFLALVMIGAFLKLLGKALANEGLVILGALLSIISAIVLCRATITPPYYDLGSIAAAGMLMISLFSTWQFYRGFRT